MLGMTHQSLFNNKKKPAFTLIEALVFLFIFAVSVVSLYEAFNTGINYAIESKKKLQAITLANEKIEKMRNLGFENLVDDTTENEQITRSGVAYQVTTRITDFDDPADGVPPADEINWDYFKIGVEVKWGLSNKKINMSAIVVPPVREEDADKGYMRLHVIDQQGDGLSFASVVVREIANNRLVYSGPVNSSGNIFLTGLNPGNHRITVNDDDGYYPVETMDTTASFDPYDKHTDIAVKTLAEKYIQTDKKSTLNVSLKNTFNETISNLGFEIKGGKYLGLENGTTAVYNFSDSVTNSDGTESFSNMSFGPYFFSFTDLNDGTNTYQFLWMTPKTDTENKLSLNADTTFGTEAMLASESVPSLLVTVVDPADGNSPIVEASVRLQFSGTPAYDSGGDDTTDQFGKFYFPQNNATEMINDNYQLTVSADGYAEKTETVTIDNFTTKTVELNP